MRCIFLHAIYIYVCVYVCAHMCEYLDIYIWTHYILLGYHVFHYVHFSDFFIIHFVFAVLELLVFSSC